MANELTINNGSMSIFTNAQIFAEAGNIAKVLAQSTIIPKAYQGNIPNILIALDMSLRMKTSPMQVMQNLYVVNGSPAWSSQYIIAVINASGKYKHELKFEFAGKGETLSCYAWTTAQDGEKLVGPTITMEMAKAEGWIDRSGSKWKTMPEVMIRYRAASFFGRLYCSDMIMGIYAEEEVESIVTYNAVAQIEQEAREEIATNANAIIVEPNLGECADKPITPNASSVTVEEKDNKGDSSAEIDF
jgi:hypothetical protein